MKNKLILFHGLFSLTALSMGFCEEDRNTPSSEVAVEDSSTSENLVAWGFTSKKSEPKVGTIQDHSKAKSKTEKEPEQVGNYNDITKKGGWIFAEFLYWQPSTAGLPIGLKSSTTDNGIAAFSVLSSPREHHISYDFHPGFRVGLGCRLPYDQWDLYSQWTQIDVHGRKTISASTGKILATMWELGNSSMTAPSSIVSKGVISLKIADLELGKVFYVSRPFALRPSIGARGVWIHQGTKLTYVNGTFTNLDRAFSAVGNEDTHLKNRYVAGGLRGALSFDWNFKEGWALYGKTGFSFLWGRYKADGRSDFTGLLSGQDFNISFKQASHFNALKSNFDVTAGLSWTKVFSQKLRLSFNAGYEFNFWPNQQELKDYGQTSGQAIGVPGLPATPPGSVIPSKQPNDLGFQGLNVGGRIDF